MQINIEDRQNTSSEDDVKLALKVTHTCSSFCSGLYKSSSVEPRKAVSLLSLSEYGKYTLIYAPGETMLNFGWKTSILWITWYIPERVKAVWLPYCPTLFLLRHGKWGKFDKQGSWRMLFYLLSRRRNYDYTKITKYLLVISWYVLVIIKSALFIEIRSVVN